MLKYTFILSIMLHFCIKIVNLILKSFPRRTADLYIETFCNNINFKSDKIEIRIVGNYKIHLSFFMKLEISL